MLKVRRKKKDGSKNWLSNKRYIKVSLAALLCIIKSLILFTKRSAHFWVCRGEQAPPRTGSWFDLAWQNHHVDEVARHAACLPGIEV